MIKGVDEIDTKNAMKQKVWLDSEKKNCLAEVMDNQIFFLAFRLRNLR